MAPPGVRAQRFRDPPTFPEAPGGVRKVEPRHHRSYGSAEFGLAPGRRGARSSPPVPYSQPPNPPPSPAPENC